MAEQAELTGSPPVSRRATALAVFGFAFAALFAGLAVSGGIGDPDIPPGDAAIVEGVSSGKGTITEAEANRFFALLVRQNELKQPPKPGSPRYEELKTVAMDELLDGIWIEGEAEELGIAVTDKRVAAKLREIKEQSYPTKAAFDEFLQTAGYTPKDVVRQVRLQELGARIQETEPAVARPSSEEVEDFYEAAKSSQFALGPTRDIRIIVNDDQAKIEAARRELQVDNSPEAWERAFERYSADKSTTNNGGFKPEVGREALSEPLKANVFQSSPGQLIGPVEFQSTIAIFEVVKSNPAKTLTLGEVRAQLITQLEQRARQTWFADSLAEYQDKWRARTFCAEGFIVERCSNYVGGHPQDAPPACYEPDPQKAPAGCPAPVAQRQPALPGSVTLLAPMGVQLPQRPRPAESAEDGRRAPRLTDASDQRRAFE